MTLHGTLFLLWLIAGFPAGAEEWKLVWSDEFDKSGTPDPAKWSYEEGFVRNNELQYYTPGKADNARIVDGMLILEARKEQLTNPAFDPSAKEGWKRMRKIAEYTSASIITRGKAAWTFGRIEVRAKLPTGKGLWPAIWMLGSDRKLGWPDCGEIDIMENVGFDPNIIHANIHTKKYNHVLRTNKGNRITIAKPYEDFHNYSIEWYPDRIDFFVDDFKYFIYTNERSGPDAWPFDKDQYLILNIAVGGNWGGQQGIDDSTFPQRMYVDYVRVYQRTGKIPDTPR